MSTLYLSGDPRVLAEKLAAEIDQQFRGGDCFAPVRVVVPNRFQGKWLRLQLARTLGVAVNVEFQNLEDALWKLIEEVGPDSNSPIVEPVNDNVYRLMVLSALLDGKNAHLARLDSYLQREGGHLTRVSCRRAWRLADRLGLLIRDYEYSRQESFIQFWLRQESALNEATPYHQSMERAQRALFHEITREPDGKRARLQNRPGRYPKTFPQFAMERMASPNAPVRPGIPVHFFGFTEICELHSRVIAWLGACFDVKLYHLNVAAGLLQGQATSESLRAISGALRTPGQLSDANRGAELLFRWGRAGGEALTLLDPVLDSRAFSIELLDNEPPAKRSSRGAGTVLARLQLCLKGGRPPRTRIARDKSLQIVGCPGIAREVEVVYNSVVQNLQDDPTLRQTDIAILATDMARYRAPLQAVFERPPYRVHYNMVDFSAASSSMFGQALLGMLDLALESFTRSRVFDVLLNPCFLTRFGMDRAEAMTWMGWAESLGVYQGWDAVEKAQQGYSRSPRFTWQLGLRRLRLGRYMDAQTETTGGPSPRFEHVIPFADLGSSDREHLDAFCRAVEGLLPRLAELRTLNLSGNDWARVLRRLVHDYLDVPADREEENQVRAALLRGIDEFSNWDAIHQPDQGSPGLPLALVREYVQSQLQTLPGNRGEYLVGGVTIGELQPMRPVPFAIVYILGLGEDSFPGPNSLSSFDLRSAARLPGDIRPAEARLYDLLATILSAEKKLYLFYNNRDLLRDQTLLPAVPLVQISRFLEANLIKGIFERIDVPQRADDPRFLDPESQREIQDVLVQCEGPERSLALLAALKEHRLELTEPQRAEWSIVRQSMARPFSIPANPERAARLETTIPLGELRRFLILPAEAALRRHLRINDDDEPASEEVEPLVTSQAVARHFETLAIRELIHASIERGVDAAVADWKMRFTENYAEACLRSQVPEDAFGEIDREVLSENLRERIQGRGQVESFLREHESCSFCGPVLLGESLTPLGARLRFPALKMELEGAQVRIVGWTEFVWSSADRVEVLVLTNSEPKNPEVISRPMLEPALLYLALLANAEPNDEGLSSRAWLEQRDCLLHLVHPKGVLTWRYPHGCISPDQAAAYLTQLVADLLQPSQFDLLPFDMIRTNVNLRQAFKESATIQIAPDVFRASLETMIEEDEEKNENRQMRVSPVVTLMGATVPPDAGEKVNRRFGLLSRGVFEIRTAPTKEAATGNAPLNRRKSGRSRS